MDIIFFFFFFLDIIFKSPFYNEEIEAANTVL